MASKRDRMQPELLALIRQGKTTRAAAAELGIHRSTAQRWLKAIAEKPVQKAHRKTRRRRLWYERDDPKQGPILRAMHQRLCALRPGANPDDPRLVMAVAVSDDPVIVQLRRELTQAGLWL